MEKLPQMNLVNTAVKFLQNPKVQESNRHDQMSFLEKKGLTKEEIDLAFDEIGKLDFNKLRPAQSEHVRVAELSTWQRLREHLVSFVIVGGASYAVYRFVKIYLLPLFWEDPLEKRLRGLEERSQRHLTLAEETMKQMRDLVELLRDDIKQQDAKIDSMTRYQGADVGSLNDIKSGITTLKGLLLNRRQFPPTPAVSSEPVIPVWQRGDSSASKNDQSTLPTHSGIHQNFYPQKPPKKMALNYQAAKQPTDIQNQNFPAAKPQT